MVVAAILLTLFLCISPMGRAILYLIADTIRTVLFFLINTGLAFIILAVILKFGMRSKE